MSSIEYRERIRRRREQANLTSFRGQSGNVRHTAPADDDSPAVQMEDQGAQGEPTPVQTGETLDHQEHLGERQPDQVVDTPTAQTGTNAILPEGTHEAMTPQQMRDQAATTAQTLAQLDEQAYNQALADLEKQNPTFYAIVVDELNNLAAQQQQEEGDGFDLSGIAGGGEDTESQEAAGTTDQQPEQQDAAGDTPDGEQQDHV